MNVICVGDITKFRKTVDTMFQGGLRRIHHAETGEEGIVLVSQLDYDVIISDSHLLAMNGFEFFRGIREANRNSMKILVVDNDESMSSEYVEQVGIDAVVSQVRSDQEFKRVLLSAISSTD